ncbi:hypothetical protein ABZ896_12390 [Streptomyces sp. NPDC047072]|uniref:hypothetical protein n=1 Tax=Streptomyces sp. NPDC047072 TaxID=3154809 RepID=UPI00340FC8ED
MKDATTADGETVPAYAIEQLLPTIGCDSGLRRRASAVLTEEATYAYGLAYGLSGGGDLRAEAHDVAVTNLLGKAVPAAVAFALYHLDALLPDLTAEQWDRINCRSLHLRIKEELSAVHDTDTEDLPPALPECQN